jgi:predicted transglutaminase-like cysteine proteinase
MLAYRLLPPLASIMVLPVMTGVAQAQPQKPAFMPVGDVADAPGGFTDMCSRDQLLCLAGQSSSSGGAASYRMANATPSSNLADCLSGRATAATPVEAVATVAPACLVPATVQTPITVTAPTDGRSSDDLLAQARQVNSAVNRAIMQVSDRASRGVDEYWARPTTAGDCEDLAIEKRMRLMEAGFPTERLFYAVSYLPAYGLHSVLILRLNDGDYVLDSLSPHVLRWSKTRYIWLRQQVPGQPLVWRRVAQPSALYATNLTVDFAKSAS